MVSKPNSHINESPQLKNDWYWYHFYLFQDPEFTQEVDQLTTYLRKTYPDIDLSVLYFNSVDVLRAINIGEVHIEQLLSLAKKYQIELEQLSFFINGHYAGLKNINPMPLAGSVEDGLITIQFSPDITQKEYEHYWNFVKRMKVEAGRRIDGRNRGPNDWRLIYAIHKARRAGMSFKQIFDAYQFGKLAGYSGSKTQYKSEDALENYFDRYKFRP